MSVIAVTMVKDELDILPYTLRRMQQQVDHIILADNKSTDGTRAFLSQYAADNDITILHDDDPAYFQSRKMTNLALIAKEMGAEWVVPFDADEVWVADEPLCDLLPTYDATVVQVHLYDHVATASDPSGGELGRRGLLDPVWNLPWRRLVHAPLPKVCFRPLTGFIIDQGNHGVHYPGPVEPVFVNEIHIRHFPYRSAEQMARKARNGAAAYAAAGDAIPHSVGQHWREYGRFYEEGGLEAIREIFDTWFYSSDPHSDPDLVLDPCPV